MFGKVTSYGMYKGIDYKHTSQIISNDLHLHIFSPLSVSLFDGFRTVITWK